LTLLKHRFPHLFPHPPLLAHTVYQTVVFDESIKRGGFNSSRTWKALRRRNGATEGALDGWQGLTEEILNTDDWFERWWQGEKECELAQHAISICSKLKPCDRAVASEQYEEITNSPDAWTLVEVSEGASVEDPENGFEQTRDYKPTIGARQVRALVEQVAGECERDWGIEACLIPLPSRPLRFFTHAPP
jgi:hypothetical protein